MKTLFSFMVPLSVLVLALACGAETTPATLPTPTATPALAPTASPSPTPTATPTPLTQEFLELFRRSVERFDDLTSYRASMTVKTRSLGRTADTVLEIEVGQDRRIHLDMEIGLGGAVQAIEVISIPPHVYARVSKLEWLRMNSEALGGVGVGLGELVDDPLGFRGALYPGDAAGITPDIYSIVSAGREVTDGLETEHLQIEIDLQKLLQALSEEQVEKYFSVFLGGENLFPEAAGTLRQVRTSSLESWIDDDGYTRRMFLELSAGDIYSTLVELRMFDVNEEIAIDPPQEFGIVQE